MKNNSNQYKPLKVIRLGYNASITVNINGESLTLRESEDKVSFDNALVALKNEDWYGLYKAMRPAKVFATQIDSITIDKNGVYFNGSPIHNAVASRILEFAQMNLDYKPLCHFLEKLMQNPSRRAVEELYNFLEHKHLPITDNGNFLAYKGLQSDYYSIHAGTQKLIKGKTNSCGQIYNGVGEEIVMERRDVCDDKEVACGVGVHAGSVSYATSFARGACVIVEINPKDVVSIPSDCNCQKLRTCAYKVVDEYRQPLSQPLYESRWIEEDEGDGCCGGSDCECDIDLFDADEHFSTPGSSWLGRVEYYSDREILDIYTLDGDVMRYVDVPYEEFSAFADHVDAGNSAGKYYHRNIKNSYSRE